MSDECFITRQFRFWYTYNCLFNFKSNCLVVPDSQTRNISARNLSKELPAFQNEIAIKHKLASSSSSNSSNNELLHSSAAGGISDHHSARMMECYPPPIPCQPLPMPTPINPVRILRCKYLDYFFLSMHLLCKLRSKSIMA